MFGSEEENRRMREGEFITDDDEPDDSSDDDFSYDFKNYTKSTKLNWRHLKPMSAWVFWSEDAVASESAVICSSGGVPNSVPEAPITNGKVINKIRSVIQKLIIDFEDLESGFLIQLWAPRIDGNRCVLTTADQPFGLSKIEEALCKFRMKCVEYKFCVDAGSANDPGLLGVVFQENELAFTPDIRFYLKEEYPQRCDARKSFVRTSMAFPVIEPSTRRCVGVLDLVTTKVIWPNRYLVVQVNKELQDAGLKSSDTYGHTFTVDSKAHNHVLEEISKGMRVVCETHKLLLGQTWVPCRCCRDVKLGGSCSMCYVSCKGQVMSTIGCEQAFYALDEDSHGFVDHFLRSGHGVGGRALLSNSLCFCKDVTRFSKTEYPLVHLARMYGLTSCFAICLRSTYTGDVDYVMEFFLPRNKTCGRVPRGLLYSILATMKQHFQSFKFSYGEELGQELSIEVIKVSKDRRLGDSFQLCQITLFTPTPALRNVGEMVQLDSTNQQLMMEANAMNNETNVVGHEQNNIHDVIYSKSNGSVRTSKRQKTETENLISYDFLTQLFGRTVKDAAKILKVSPSTFKRILRKQGIKRWPRCKKMKINGSLTELKQPEEPLEVTVIENEETSHDLRDLYPIPTAVKASQQGSDLELHPAMSMSPGYDPDAAISEQPEISVKGAFTEIMETSHDFGNLCPALQDRQHDLEQEFQKVIGNRVANSPSDSHFPTVQLEKPLQETTIDKESHCPLVRDACQEKELELHLVAMSTVPTSVTDAKISTRPEDSIRGAFTESAGSSHSFINLRPVFQDCQHDSELEFRQAIGTLRSNSPSDAHFPAVRDACNGEFDLCGGKDYLTLKL